jgi:hypothetical protein
MLDSFSLPGTSRPSARGAAPRDRPTGGGRRPDPPADPRARLAWHLWWTRRWTLRRLAEHFRVSVPEAAALLWECDEGEGD